MRIRQKLKAIDGERRSFVATFERLGRKAGYNGQDFTVILTNVRLSSGEAVTGHLWFNYTKGFQDLYLVKGDRVSFDARATAYTKGSHGTIDYKLSHPTKIKKIPFGEWGDLVKDPTLEVAFKIESRAAYIFNAVELAVLNGASVDADEFLLTFRAQHAPGLEGVGKAWLNHYDYMVRNAGNLAAILEAYRNKNYASYVALHDPHSRVDALLALRQLGGFNGSDYWRVLKQLQDDKCELQRTDAWRRLLRPFHVDESSN
jgi:hypothetical protein